MLHWLARKLKERKTRRLEQTRLATEAFRSRLVNPDFDLIRRHYGAPISESLRKVYSDRVELIRDCVTRKYGPCEDDVLFIAWYIPLDEQAHSEQWHHDDGQIDFADDGTGSRYAVEPTNNEAEILYFRHEDQTFHPTGVRICDFLGLPET